MNKDKKKKTIFNIDDKIIETVNVPDEMKESFKTAESKVTKYFDNIEWDPKSGRLLIGGERYILMRASSMRLGFPEILAELMELDGGMNNPYMIKLIYQFAKSLGKSDAKKFHLSMGLDDPIEKLSTGPVLFAFTGWAKVDIKSDSNPVTNEDFLLIYTHPKSFEADTFMMSKGDTSKIPICIMNAGYSAGWCSESFNLELDAREVSCRAMGDSECLFIMAQKDHLEKRVIEYLKKKKNKVN